MAGDRQTSTPSVFISAKSEPSVEVGQIVNQLLERVGLIFQSRGDGQAIPLREKADDAPSPCRYPGGIHQAESSPKHGGSRGSRERLAGFHEVALSAVIRQHFALDWTPQSHAAGIHRH